MKILQALPELNSGGVEHSTLALASYLTQKSHFSYIVSNGGQHVPRLEKSGTTHIQLPIHKKSPSSLLQIPRIKKLLLELAPDILHLRSRVPAWLFFLAWKQLPLNKRPKLVTTVHGFYSVSPYSAIMTKGEYIICVSNSVKDYVLSNYPKSSEKNIQIIYEGVNQKDYFADFQPNSQWLDSWYTEFPETQNKVLLTLPGRITRLKGHQVFLEVFQKLSSTHPNLHAIIAGGHSSKKQSYFNELKQLVHKLGLVGRVTFTGSRNDLREILSISSVSYSLSTQAETFGLTALESLSIGTPVIGYDDGGTSEILTKLFPYGLVKRDDQEQLIEKTKTILADPPYISPNQTFLLDKTHEQTLALYNRILGN